VTFKVGAGRRIWAGLNCAASSVRFSGQPVSTDAKRQKIGFKKSIPFLLADKLLNGKDAISRMRRRTSMG